METQDSALVRERRGLCIIGLADGQSGRVFSAEGAARSLALAADYIERAGLAVLLGRKYQDETAYEMLREVRGGLEALASERGVNVKELASTLLVLAFHPRSRRCLIVHLGDGQALGVRDDGSLFTLSGPENGFTRRHTWLTTSADALLHLRVGAGSLDGCRRVLLLTDGAREMCRNPELLARGGAARLEQRLRDMCPADDASVLAAELSRR